MGVMKNPGALAGVTGVSDNSFDINGPLKHSTELAIPQQAPALAALPEGLDPTSIVARHWYGMRP